MTPALLELELQDVTNASVTTISHVTALYEGTPFVRGQPPLGEAGAMQAMVDKRDNKGFVLISTNRTAAPSEDVQKSMHVLAVEGISHISSVERKETVPNRPTHGISRKVEFWRVELNKLNDTTLAERVLGYVQYGAPIGVVDKTESVNSDNWPSSNVHREAVTKFIEENIEKGSIEGPLDVRDSEFHVSPVGAFEKKNSKKVRVIHDLSWPPSKSINDCRRLLS